ncbi:hypothetical protein O3P69_000416 [Scylla paramamosain]|uniref:Uncharacterized protein n=1 Tax=Scylla paramamosain TaxID=85552 RepID=A0AAW0UT09_SCYPA
MTIRLPLPVPSTNPSTTTPNAMWNRSIRFTTSSDREVEVQRSRGETLKEAVKGGTRELSVCTDGGACGAALVTSRGHRDRERAMIQTSVNSSIRHDQQALEARAVSTHPKPI